MCKKFKVEIVLQSCSEESCDYGSAIGIFCWFYDVLGETHLTCLSDLIDSKADCHSGDP